MVAGSSADAAGAGAAVSGAAVSSAGAGSAASVEVGGGVDAGASGVEGAAGA